MNFFLRVLPAVVFATLIAASFVLVVGKYLSEYRNEYSYKNCVERYVMYNKVDAETAKTECKKVWKE